MESIKTSKEQILLVKKIHKSSDAILTMEMNLQDNKGFHAIVKQVLRGWKG